MSKVWINRQDVDIAVSCIAQIHSKTGTLPPELVAAYKEILVGNSKGMVSRFYEQLTLHCPSALPLFSVVKT